MRRFEACPSRPKIAALFLGNLLLTAAAAWCITQPQIQAKLAGVAGVLFFGIGLYVFPRAWFRAAVPKIIMDDDGIHTGSSLGTVEWDDVTEFRIDSIRGTKFLSIFVKDVSKYLDRMSPLARRSAQSHPLMGVSEITLCFTGLSPGLADACYYLRERGYEIITKRS
jgi:hypothetical protein